MIAISRSAVLVIIAVMTLVGLPLALTHPEYTLGNIAMLLPMVLLLEFAIYGILTLASNPRMTVTRVAGIATSLVVLRAVCSLAASAIATALEPTAAVAPLDAWVASPIPAVLQVVVLLLVAPHLVAFVDSRALDEETLAKLTVGERAPTPSRSTRPTTDRTSPTGGFIQVFSYEELAAMLRKTPGLEGFVIYSGEGLVTWRDLPMRLEVDALAARLKATEAREAMMMEENRLGRLRRVVLQTREHTICVQDLNSNFGLVLVYNGRVSLGEVDERIDVIAKTAREFLQWKYPGLTLIVPAASKNAMEAV